MTLAEKGQHVVFTQAVELDITHDYHVIVLSTIDSRAHYLLRVFPITTCHVFPKFCHSPRRVQQAFTVRVIDQITDQLLDRFDVGIEF